MHTKHSVSVAIHDDTGRVLVVLRPPDDKELPNLWGLPASSLRPGEGWEQSVRRTARDKLGVEVEVGRELRRGSADRPNYRLEMRLFEARIVSGAPKVRDDVEGVTHYADWKWGNAETLKPAADRGSLCCRLYLRYAGSGT